MNRIFALSGVVVLITGLVASAQYPPEKPRGVRPPVQSSAKTSPTRIKSPYLGPTRPAANSATASRYAAPHNSTNPVEPKSAGSEPFNPFGAIRDEAVIPVADTQPIKSTSPGTSNTARKTIARPAVRAATGPSNRNPVESQPSTVNSQPPATPRTASLPKRVETITPGELLPENVVPRKVEPVQPQPVPVAEPESQPEPQPVLAAPPAATPRPVASPAPVVGNNRLVLTRRAPQLTVEATGARRVTVGKEAIYNVSVRNQGDEAAENVLVLVGLPSGVELRDAQAGSGLAAASTDPTQPGLEWRIDRVAPQAKLDLALKLVPRQSQPFDLKLQWICSPAGAQALVEVEEPRLQLNISGPTEVIYGQPQMYKLTVSNPGNGNAENATIYLLPLDPREGQAASQNLGTLTAGASRSVEIELVPRQNGQVTIQAEATADGDLKTATQYPVRVRRGELRVAVNGPRQVLAGVPAQYEIRVQNPGDAPAKNVHITTALPNGAEPLTIAQQGQHLPQRNEITWKLDQLPAGGEQVLYFKTVLRTGGAQRVVTNAVAEGELLSNGEVTTNVAAYPDLTLEVTDSPGPIALGQPVTYEIRVKNRGTGMAEGLELIAYFSEGIEPTQVDGGAGEIGSGVVTIRPTKSLPQNGEMLYRVKARATTAGQHKIRVELGCQTLGSKITQEDSTLFYSDEPEPTQPTSAGSGLLPTPTAPQTPSPLAPR
ncbi:MAG: hypothetical protein JNM18_14010 [Planctomycetaceae bacterium]|nr:hypothetical protein [Planctomycetaceae bacterium]